MASTTTYNAHDPLAASPPTSGFVDQTFPPMFSIMTKGHNSHPSFPHLTLLVCEAVLEVVVVSALGYLAAKRGMFSGEAQKTMANLNIYFFTPCLIFSKLAKQLEGDKLMELAIIPIILLVQTLVSFLSSKVMARVFQIRKLPQRNFVTAMAVFGNSNSLPLSLVISLAHTISGLHWDKVPNDNDNDVAARGILYLLIFSQLGQALRWSWGMNSLLRPLSTYTPKELGEDRPDSEESGLLNKNTSGNSSPRSASDEDARVSRTSSDTLAEEAIITDETTAASSSVAPDNSHAACQQQLVTLDGHVAIGDIDDPPPSANSPPEPATEGADHIKLARWHMRRGFSQLYHRTADAVYTTAVPPSKRLFHALPSTVQKVLSRIWSRVRRIAIGILSCINVPLAAIIVSVIVATIPSVKSFFYTPGSFVNNTFTSAVNQLGGVAVPLILFILGGNLCRSTQPQDDPSDLGYKKEKNRMLACALLSRMVIPLVIMAPLLALTAKYLPISILDDPIFLIVCFLLTGAPSALQLAQMCQVNDLYVPVMANLLVHSYVIWIFPSTLVLVLLALEVVEWAVPNGGLSGEMVKATIKAL